MKVRVTFVTENRNPIEGMGENPEDYIKKAYDFMMVMAMNNTSEARATVEKVEIIDERQKARMNNDDA